jgi:tetratricopeptide (TPR) repeat protein
MLTDIVGYTSLTQRDEAGALRLLEEHRQIVRPLLRDHAGREVKTIGDAFLVEFGNALDATRCAIAIQKSLHERNSRTSSTRIEIRIGLHVGDVVQQSGDIYGDAVNIVSRVEPMAEPGGICVSGAIYDQVRNKVDVSLVPLGAPALKNVEFPVPLFRVELPWMVTSLAPKTPWVDRPVEQQILRQALDRAAKGEGSVIVLLGESGVGKTRLAEETIRSAERSGFRVLRGRAFPGELASPYAHWAEMVREFLDDAPPALLQRVGWSVAGEVAKITPAFAQKVGAPPPQAAPTDPESARARFYEAVTEFFTNLSQDAPLLLLFDDLQWADATSLHLLEFVVRSVANHRMLLLATSQEPEADGASTLSEVYRYLGKNRLLTLVPLRRMDQGAVGAMIQKTFGGGEISQEFSALVHERTGGNPFFVEEVLRSLVEEGAIYRTPEGAWERKDIQEIGIPKTVREVVKQRVNRLDEPTQSTLRIAAVLGVEFPFELLREVAQIDEERLIEQLERLVRAGLLEESTRPARLLSYHFPDPQIRQVLYGEMLSPRRARYHRRAAESLEKIAGKRREEFAGDLAVHFREGQDVAKAREYATLAAEQWVKVYGFDEAERQYRTAFQLEEEAPDERARAQILDGLGRVHFALGRLDRATTEWEKAIQLYEAVGEVQKAGGLCPWLADTYRLHPELAPGRPQLVDEVLEKGRSLLERVPPSRELVRVYDMYGTRLAELERPAEARSMAEKGIEVARSIGDRDAEMSVQGTLYQFLPLTEKDRMFDILNEGLQYFSRPGSEAPDQLVAVLSNLSFERLSLANDVADALRLADEAVAVAQKARNREWEALGRSRKAWALLWRGEVQRAEEELQKARELRELAPGSYDNRIERYSGSLALARGQLERAARHFSHAGVFSEGHEFLRYVVIDLADLHRQRGELNEAIRLLREAVHQERVPLTELPATAAFRYIGVRAALLEALFQGPSELRGAEEIEKLAGELHQAATGVKSPIGLGLDLRTQGELATLEGRTADAVARLEEAVEWFRKSGNASYLARGLHLLGEARRNAGLLEQAEVSEKESAKIFGQLKGTEK